MKIRIARSRIDDDKPTVTPDTQDKGTNFMKPNGQNRVIDKDGLVREEDGKYATTFVDSCITADLAFPAASVIGLRLYQSTSHRHGRDDDQDDHIADSDVHQFRMTTRAARILANRLLELADHLEGNGAQRH